MRLLLVTGTLFFGFSSLDGINTSSVFSADVKKGDPSMEYRSGYDPDSNDFAHRIHYQYGFSESWRMRLILLQSKNALDDLEFRYARWEGQWQFLEDEEAGWDSALRFEVQLADFDDVPSRVRVAWTGKKDLNEDWQVRGNFLTGHQFGEKSNDGFLLESRAQISRKLNNQWRFAIDYYGDMNTTKDIGSFDDQEHQLGPLLKFSFNDGFTGNFGALYGISDGAPDKEYRFTLIYGF